MEEIIEGKRMMLTKSVKRSCIWRRLWLVIQKKRKCHKFIELFAGDSFVVVYDLVVDFALKDILESFLASQKNIFFDRARIINLCSRLDWLPGKKKALVFFVEDSIIIATFRDGCWNLQDYQGVDPSIQSAKKVLVIVPR